jgi:hypothetical protein
MWRAGFGRGFGPVVRQTAKCMNERMWDVVTVILKILLLGVKFLYLIDRTELVEKAVTTGLNSS